MSEIHYRRDAWKLFEGMEGAAAEIGVAEGRSSRQMLTWPGITRLYLVDRWQTNPDQKGDAAQPQEWHDNNRRQVAEIADPRVKMLDGDSVLMAQHVPDNFLIFLFIDGDHCYEGVKADLLAWVPKVMPGGVVALHDYEQPNYGVKRAVNEFCRARGFSIHPIPEDKPEDAGAWFRVP